MNRYFGMMKRHYVFSSIGLYLILSIVAGQVSAADASEFPGRKLYLAIPYIELEDLHKRLGEVIFVDVRSEYEFQTLRIKNAKNIPLAAPNFANRMRILREREPDKTIVAYCNGKTCMKSYKAVRKCRISKIKNVVAFDAGVMDWARTYPAEAVLLGVSPVDPAKLITKSRFKKYLIEPDKFEKMASEPENLVLDVRDRFQREGISLFVGFEKQANLDDKSTLDKYIDRAKRENKTLLIYDAAGKQVRWLMYYLEEKKVKKYYFMKGGALAYFNSLREQYVR